MSVHEGGVSIGLLCFSWREVVGWAWGYGTAAGHLISLNISGRDRRGLCVWTTSGWRWIYEPQWRWFHEPRPQRPIYTRIARDGDLEALLQKYAPQAERSSPAVV